MNQRVEGAIVLCPGFHAPELTDSFCQQLDQIECPHQRLVFPSDRYGAYDALAVVRFLHEQLSRQSAQDWLARPLILIGFSAGAVAAMGAALMLESLGGTIGAVFLLDGWGVPIAGQFPTYRLSHDRFTHWSSAFLGGGQESFYADPTVDHLTLWRSPASARGFAVKSEAPVPVATTALKFLTDRLKALPLGVKSE